MSTPREWNDAEQAPDPCAPLAPPHCTVRPRCVPARTLLRVHVMETVQLRYWSHRDRGAFSRPQLGRCWQCCLSWCMVVCEVGVIAIRDRAKRSRTVEKISTDATTTRTEPQCHSKSLFVPYSLAAYTVLRTDTGHTGTSPGPGPAGPGAGTPVPPVDRWLVVDTQLYSTYQ